MHVVRTDEVGRGKLLDVAVGLRVKVQADLHAHGEMVGDEAG